MTSAVCHGLASLAAERDALAAELEVERARYATAAEALQELDDDLVEARSMIRAGQGARALHEYFGWPHPRAVRIAAALRDELAA